MKQIDRYITEKLVINKDIKTNDYLKWPTDSKEISKYIRDRILKDIHHLEISDVYKTVDLYDLKGHIVTDLWDAYRNGKTILTYTHHDTYDNEWEDEIKEFDKVFEPKDINKIYRYLVNNE